MPETGPTNREVLSVSQLNRAARQLLEGEFPMVFVEGEISNFSRPSSGHWYLTLKDTGAQLRCAMFVNRNRLVRFSPKNGLMVMVRGRISLYEGRGEFQLIVEHMEEAGDGALRRAFDALKARLEAEGLFAADAKRPLPTLPSHLCVITSPTGAAIRDVLHVLARRFPGIPVTVLPVAVQGEDAVPQIVKALAFANRYEEEPFDVILLTRGGGSLEDLWAFNTEQVVRAVHASRLPVICAVGHETDFTIADFAADVRAPTPSAAAEILSPNGAEWLTNFARIERTLGAVMNDRIARMSNQVNHVSRRLRHPGARLTDLHQRLDDLEMRMRRSFTAYLGGFRFDAMSARLMQAMERRLERARASTRLAASRLQAPQTRLAREQVRLDQASARLQAGFNSEVRHRHQRLDAANGKLTALSPLAVLSRGYAIVMKGDAILRDASDVAPGEQITARLHHGHVIANVTRSEEDHEPDH